MRYWKRTGPADPAARVLADRHYSRQTLGAREFLPNGRKIVLVIPEYWPSDGYEDVGGYKALAVWGWHAPKPGMTFHDGRLGEDWYRCAIFRNESKHLSSGLIREAVEIACEIWGRPNKGFFTEVWPEKVRSTTVPQRHYASGKPDRTGWCYQKAGWILSDDWTTDGKKRRLYLPIEALEDVICPNCEAEAAD